MFIIDTISKKDATGDLALMYEKMEKQFGFIPPHFELFATIDLKGLKQFIKQYIYITNHESIDAKVLPYLRLFIATKECREYCVAFNSKLLLSQSANKKFIENIEDFIFEIPVNETNKLLVKKVIKALYDAKNFQKEDLEELRSKNGNFSSI